ncbi:hypothetical protein GUITHDRAFT_151594 [Guillardia theta CCMP2712]|uniref:Uncharacterized protein n=1 Tax=Guillardia theta (strain CCMP2712) TaxID=905079 RepID=L1JLN8_GUITC|nr:hypothetical protein GUITHDRAFT_151594 [Guillardia theta CCMP2712]EKX49045.1 hypothetical protein GUITHDRAFT_151594 [Guillardia theta CCMP2712]|eukprot:XP_005836025.1 hypothetical protein GUITHDRAFT_151594 [Guillardia theta CCMP2712]
MLMSEMRPGSSMLLLLLLLVSSCHGQPGVKLAFTSPQDGSRVWIDEEHPLKISIDVSGAKFPQDGSIALFVNGHDTGQRLSKPPFEVAMTELDDRNYRIDARFFDKKDRPTEHVASVTFMARRYLELMEHEEYHVSAEGPRGDGFDGMAGLESWEWRPPELDSLR